MDIALLNTLQKAGVKDSVISILEDEEFDTVDLLNTASDEFLSKSCGIKGGQIARIRSATASMINKENIPISVECVIPIAPRTPTSSKELETSFSTPTACGSLPTTPSTPSGVLTTSRTPINTPKSSQTPTYHPKKSQTPISTPSNSQTPTTSQSQSQTPTATASKPMAKTVSPLPSPGFAIREKKIANVNWIREFKLPSTFSPSVTDELKSGKLTGKRRDNFTRECCDAMKQHTMYPTKEEKDKVALMIVQAYPFLADSLGAGIGSWSMAIHNRFKNMRRKPRVPAIKTKAQPATIVKEPLPKKRKVVDIPQLADGETEETCEEHTKQMKIEMAKPRRNASQIKELMQLTYPHRRQLITTGAVKDVIKEYPALRLVSEVRGEFGRVVEDPKIVDKMVDNFAVVEKKLLRLAESSTNKNVKFLLNQVKNAEFEEPSKQAALESTVAVLVLQHLLKDKSSDNPLLKICSDDDSIDDAIEGTAYPKLIGSGELGELDPLVIAVEGKVLINVSKLNIPKAVSLLVGIFYVLNMEYAPGATNIYAFIEAILMEKGQDARKRVSVQKLIKELDLNCK